MKCTTNYVFIFIAALVFCSVVSAESDYCTPYPNDITTSIVHEGDWWNITFTSPSCFTCIDNGAMMGDVTCTPCAPSGFTSNVTCAIVPGGVLFTDTSGDVGITDYFWMFGDGNASIEKDPVYQYNFTGMFSVNHSIVSLSGIHWENKSNYMTIRASGDTCENPIVAAFTQHGPSLGTTIIFGVSAAAASWMILAKKRNYRFR